VSEAIGTLGTTLNRGAQHIAQIQDISGPDLSTDTDEITNHDSPDGSRSSSRPSSAPAR
jgi:hypothetical protein